MHNVSRLLLGRHLAVSCCDVCLATGGKLPTCPYDSWMKVTIMRNELRLRQSQHTARAGRLSRFASFSTPISFVDVRVCTSTMNHTKTAPYIAPRDQEVSEILAVFDAHSQKGKGPGGFHIKKKTFQLSTWQLNDWDYKKPNLPTYARGLFTIQKNGKAEIAVRGYDKFFNVGEVNETQWRNIENNTRGPYELSVKENGCIIFIAGLDDGSLIITSKHSTGIRGETNANHALVGDEWVDKHLAKVGKTESAACPNVETNERYCSRRAL
ncbi:hypothetical protein MRB53_038766 [Persea americana]|nr:hypothetical protein MRB53_038766 [Persea americana]